MATFYVDNLAINDTGSGTQSSPKKYIKSGIALMSSGDTLIIKDGTYTGQTNMMSSADNWEWSGIPNGTAGAYTIIKAENHLGAVIDGENARIPMNLNARQYVQIEGIHFRRSGNINGGSNCVIYGGNHVKIIKCASEETYFFHFRFHHTKYCLIEDTFMWGRGAYGIIFGGSYGAYTDSQYNIARRCVSRRDAHYYDTGGNHNCDFVSYQADNAYFQNCIAVDGVYNYVGNPSYPGFTKAVFFTANGSSNFNVDGCIAINDYGQMAQCESGASVNFRNNAFVLAASGGLSGLFTYGTSVVDNNILSGAKGTGDYEGGGITRVGGTLTSCRNNIIFDNRYGFITTTSGNSYNVLYNTVNNYFYSNAGTGEVTDHNPESYGLLYPARIELGSWLSTAGAAGGICGPTITNRIGTDGTLYGETGWNSDTGVALWPFPDESTIRSKMSGYTGTYNWSGSFVAINGARGFAAPGETLTHYIWNYLGNGNPYEEETLIDSYPESNYLSTESKLGYNAWYWKLGQTFTTTVLANLTSAKFYIAKYGNPTGNLVARLYTCTGTSGSSGNPGTGATPLATSDPVSASTVTGSMTLTTFTFSTGYVMNAGSSYCITIEAISNTIDTSNYILVAADSTTPTHAGNYFELINGAVTYNPYSGYDLIFYVYGSTNVTKTNATKNLVCRASVYPASAEDRTGDVHTANPAVGSYGWSSYVDITSDTNAPATWTWPEVSAVDCDIKAVAVDSMVEVGYVEIRVAYWPLPTASASLVSRTTVYKSSSKPVYCLISVFARTSKNLRCRVTNRLKSTTSLVSRITSSLKSSKNLVCRATGSPHKSLHCTLDCYALPQKRLACTIDVYNATFTLTNLVARVTTRIVITRSLQARVSVPGFGSRDVKCSVTIVRGQGTSDIISYVNVHNSPNRRNVICTIEVYSAEPGSVNLTCRVNVWNWTKTTDKTSTLYTDRVDIGDSTWTDTTDQTEIWTKPED